MFQLLFFILLLVLIIGGIMYYLNYRNNLAKTTDYKNKRTGEIFEERSQNHITNALKEIDFLSKKYSYYLGDNSSSICYDQNKNPIEGCVCHPSCSTCGYSKNPVGMNQCLTCRNNTPNNKLYSNGAGWCGSFGPNGHKYTADSDKDKSSTNDSIFSSSVPSIENAYAQTQVDTNKPMTCLERVERMCSQNQYEDSASWKECLKKNKTSLLLAGCNIPGITDLVEVRRETASASQSSSSAAGDSNAASAAAAAKDDTSCAALSSDKPKWSTVTNNCVAAAKDDATCAAISETKSKWSATESKCIEKPGWGPNNPYVHTSKKIMGKIGVKCTTDFPYPILPTQDGSEQNVSCSKFPVGSKAQDPKTRKLVDRTSIMNACALKGHRYADKSLGGILARCYPNEEAHLDNGQKRKCKDNEQIHYQNNSDYPKINSHILSASGKRCFSINQPKTAYNKRVRSTPV
mgnify:FL=1